jgi:hypothetical protein
MKRGRINKKERAMNFKQWALFVGFVVLILTMHAQIQVVCEL